MFKHTEEFIHHRSNAVSPGHPYGKMGHVSKLPGIKSANISSLDGKALQCGVYFRLHLSSFSAGGRRRGYIREPLQHARTHARTHAHTRTDAALALSVCDACKLDRLRPLSHIPVDQIQILCSRCSHLNAYMPFFSFASMPRLLWGFFFAFVFCFYSLFQILHTGNVEQWKSCLKTRWKRRREIVHREEMKHQSRQ